MPSQLSQRRPIATHRRARFDYEVLERIEAGLVLRGPEVKSLRAGKASLSDAYGVVRRGEAYLVNLHISPYEAASRENPDPRRERVRRRIGERGAGERLRPDLAAQALRRHDERDAEPRVVGRRNGNVPASVELPDFLAVREAIRAGVMPAVHEDVRLFADSCHGRAAPRGHVRARRAPEFLPIGQVEHGDE